MRKKLSRGEKHNTKIYCREIKLSRILKKKKKKNSLVRIFANFSKYAENTKVASSFFLQRTGSLFSTFFFIRSSKDLTPPKRPNSLYCALNSRKFTYLPEEESNENADGGKKSEKRKSWLQGIYFHLRLFYA